MRRTRRKPSDLPRPSDPIETDHGTDSIYTRAQEPEILNILNLPQVMLSGNALWVIRAHCHIHTSIPVSDAIKFATSVYRSTSVSDVRMLTTRAYLTDSP